jgi:peptide chain release factor 1
MFDKLGLIEKRYEELEQMIAQPEIATDPKQLQELLQERANLKDIVTQYQQYKTISRELADLEALLNDDLQPEMIALVKEERNKLEQHRDDLIDKLKLSLLPKNPNDAKDIIVEIRAGAGGEEASLFAADLFRMYSQSDVGGFKEVVFEVKGKGAFSKLKYERGVHRVQRVPVTEASGRIHTSTTTVAVLPEAKEIELNIKPDELRVDLFRSSGAGGQNVNKLTTAVRITHIPTGITATCQDERSQLKNKMKAMAVLRARLFDLEQHKQAETIERERRTQVGTGDRAEKIRTYNFPQDRITDHRINTIFHNLTEILNGELDGLLEALSTTEQAQQLEAILS